MKEESTKIWIFSVPIIFMILTAFALFSISIVSANTWYVEENESIQAAVNSATAGDTIIVGDGTYAENVDVDKRLTIKSENGSASTIVKAANSGGHVFEITTDYVNISGLTVKGATSGVGIHLHSIDHCNISDNTASNNDYGIFLHDSSNNTLMNNTAPNNYNGIALSYWSNNNILTGNIANSNNKYGISLDSSNSTLTNNTASNNKYGIRLWDSSNNILTGNIASNNYNGIQLRYSSNNTLTSNIALKNNGGIRLDGSSNNKIYLNNFVSNRKNVASYNSKNTWSYPLLITYIYNKTTYKNYLGNYWDDYSGRDDNEDGIGDAAYSINTRVKDNYPLIKTLENYAIEEEIKRPEIPTEEETTPEIPTGGEKGIPGFEAIFAVVGLLAVAYILRKKK